MAPFDELQKHYTKPTEVDASMFARFKGKGLFKVGQTERIVYEKIAGLKRININQSIMYNFSSEGAYSDSDIQFSLIGPRPDEIYLSDVDNMRENIRA